METLNNKYYSGSRIVLTTLEKCIMKTIPAFAEKSGNIHVVIETAKDSSSKYVYDKETDLFKLKKILPLGMKFPFHFGFIPGTTGEDGDPLDVLVLMDEPSHTGALVECRIIGSLKANQRDKGKTVRNDRIIAAAIVAYRYEKIKSLSDIDKKMQEEIVMFFKNYNELAGKEFDPIGMEDENQTINMIKNNME